MALEGRHSQYTPETIYHNLNYELNTRLGVVTEKTAYTVVSLNQIWLFKLKKNLHASLETQCTGESLMSKGPTLSKLACPIIARFKSVMLFLRSYRYKKRILPIRIRSAPSLKGLPLIQI